MPDCWQAENVARVRGADPSFLLLALQSPYEAHPLTFFFLFSCLQQSHDFIHKLIELLPVRFLINLRTEVSELLVVSHAGAL
jgi:hypothetical protein